MRLPRVIRILQRHWLFIASLVVFVWISSALARQFVRKYTVSAELTRLTESAQRIEQESEQLRALIEHAKTVTFIDREARLKKALQKPGEEVVVVQSDDKPVATQQLVSDTRSNVRKWIEYFLYVE